MNRAIVTDTHYRMSLAAVRSLGKRGIPVTALARQDLPKGAALGFYSRHAAEGLEIPDARTDEKGFVEALIKIAQNSGPAEKGDREIPVLIPTGMDSLMAVCRYHQQLAPYVHTLIPPLGGMEIANDTKQVLDIASQVGVPVPFSTTLGEGESVEELSSRLSYPIVIKYREGEALRLKPEKRYRIVQNASAFLLEFARMHAMQSYPIVQEYVSGPGYGVSAVFDKNSQPLEIFCHKRIREYPVTGGPSCFCESIWDDRLVDYAMRLLKELQWQGIAMVEFKGHLDGEIRLMEINPRFWGSLPLSILSGCDIPFALYRGAMGETAPEPQPSYCDYKKRYRQGQKMRYLFQDLLSFPGYLRTRKDKLSFGAGFAASLFNPTIADGVLQWRDWKPSLHYILNLFKKTGR